MPNFRKLPIDAGRVRGLVAENAHPSIPDAAWCVRQLEETSDLYWTALIPYLRQAGSAYPEVAVTLHALMLAPATPDLLRVRAGLALLWLGEKIGMDCVNIALEGADPELRCAALEGISALQEDHAWPDHFYVSLFESCQRIFDSTVDMQRTHIVSAMFDRPALVLAPFMRQYVATATDFRRTRGADWLMLYGEETDLGPYVEKIRDAPFPAGIEERQAWYSAAHALMTQMKAYHGRVTRPQARAWATSTVLAMLKRMCDLPPPEPEDDVPWYQKKKPVGVRWDGVVGVLHAIAADIGPESFPLLARWAASQTSDGWAREHAFAFYAGHAGEAAVDVLLEELTQTSGNGKGYIARQLMAVAPISRYADLTPMVRHLFDTFPAQQENSYGHSFEQESLAGLAAALAQFDPGAAMHIRTRMRELGPAQVREVQWALTGYNPARIAALLIDGGAITSMQEAELRKLRSDGDLVRRLTDAQNRLAIFNSRDDDCRSLDEQTVSRLGLHALPQITLECVTEEQECGIRFVHGDGVYCIDGGEDDYTGAAAAFNQFLSHINHPQRVFEIGDDGGETDNDIAAFFLADPARFPAVAEELGFPARLVM